MKIYTPVDEEETAKVVRRYLDKQVPRLKRYTSISLTSPQLDPIGGSHGSHGNSSESQAIRAAQASKALDEIWQAMNNCERFQRAILLREYKQGKTPLAVAQSIQYQPTQYYKKRQDALVAFADFYDAITGQDLHVYLDEIAKTKKDRKNSEK